MGIARVKTGPPRILCYAALLVACAAASGGSVPGHSATRAAAAYDVIIRHGLVFDGTGAPGFAADVAIRGDHIAAIGDLGTARGRTEIEARGLYVAPGFINIHDHATPEGLAAARNMLTQGVTFGVANADGWGTSSPARDFADLTKGGMGMNLALSIGYNAIWGEVVGEADRRPTAAELARMQGLVRAGLAAGAAGIAAGLDYAPASFSTPAETTEILAAGTPWRTYFPNHDRVGPPGFSSMRGMQETIDLASRAHVVPELTHMKIQGHEQGRAAQVAAMIDRATASGHYTTGDIYPYLAGLTSLEALLIPGWAQSGGYKDMVKRFADPRLRARIAAEAENVMTKRFGGPAGVRLFQTREDLTAVMAREQAAAGETVIRILERSPPPVLTLLRFGAEDDLTALLRHRDIAVACDCGADVPANDGHPRVYGTFPRVLGHYVRERRVLTWPDAIRKMTGLPASTVGVADRGFLAPGMVADVSVFDPVTVRDRATYEQPGILSEGIRYVLVNGRMALRDGTPTGVAAGEKVLLTAHMPTRPMATTGKRRLVSSATFTGAGGRFRIEAALHQDRAARYASGRLRMLDARGVELCRIERPGILQVAHRWTSLTGWGRCSGTAVPITVTFDWAGPAAVPGKVTVILRSPRRSFEGVTNAAAVRSFPALPEYR